MAEKPTKYTEVYEKDLFDNFIKSAEQALKTLDKLADGLKGTLEQSQKIGQQKPFSGDFEDLKRREKAIEDNRKAVEGLERVQKERAQLEEKLNKALEAQKKLNEELSKKIERQASEIKKLREAKRKQIKTLSEEEKLRSKLNRARSDEAKAIASLRLQIQQANREAKENAKIEGDLGPYAQKSATLNKLRKRYKDLAVESGANTKEAKELLKEVQKLDKELKELDSTVGQNQRNVGNYVGAVKRLSGSLKVLSAITVVAVLNQIAESFKSNEEGASILQKALLEVTVRFSIFSSAVAKAVSGVDESADAFDKITQFFSGLSSELEGFEEKVQKALISNKALVTSEKENTRTIATLTKQLGQAQRVQAEFTVAATDSTLSLEAQAEANRRLVESGSQVLKLQIQIAREEERIARERVKANKEKTGGDKASAELELALAQATQARAQAEAEFVSFRATTAATSRQVLSDELELELDVLQDAADRQKTIREKLIADETLSFKARKALLELNNEDTKEAFQTEIDLLEAFNKARLQSIADEKRALRDSLADNTQNAKQRARLATEIAQLEAEATSFKIDQDKILAESNTVLLNQQLKDLGLTEQIRTRVIQSINDRREALNDNEEAQKGLNKAESESLSIQKEAILIQEALNALQKEGADLAVILTKLEEDKLQAEIDALQASLSALDANSEEAIKKRKELNEKLLQQNKARFQKEKEQRERANKESQKQIEKQIMLERQAQEAILAIATSLFDKRFEAQNNAIDRELNAVRQRQEALRAISNEGRADADEALAAEERREAELERKKEQQARRQARVQLALSAVQTYTNKVEGDDPNPLQSTITDISLLQAFVKSLPAFYEGTENVGRAIGAPHLNTARDQYLIRADGSERIVEGKENSRIPLGMTNRSLVDYALSAYKGQSKQAVLVNQTGIDKDGLREVMNEAVERIPQTSLDYDKVERAVIEVVQRKGRTTRIHKKTGGIW